MYLQSHQQCLVVAIQTDNLSQLVWLSDCTLVTPTASHYGNKTSPFGESTSTTTESFRLTPQSSYLTKCSLPSWPCCWCNLLPVSPVGTLAVRCCQEALLFHNTFFRDVILQLYLFNTVQLAQGRARSMFQSAVEGESRLAEFSVSVAQKGHQLTLITVFKLCVERSYVKFERLFQ